MKTLGIIGGLGPMATAHLLQRIIEMTDAKADQEHLDVIVFNRPRVPDRTAYILDRAKPSPLPPMIETAKTLENLGAQCLCAPCVTSHYFYRELAGSVNVPFLNMVAETASELLSAGVKRPGILATTGTVQTGLFQTAFSDCGMEPVVPDQDGQAIVMDLIYNEIKAGKPADPEKFRKVSEMLYRLGSDCIILGCTELSLIDVGTDLRYLDALDVLAKRCVEQCDAPLKQKYSALL